MSKEEANEFCAIALKALEKATTLLSQRIPIMDQEPPKERRRSVSEWISFKDQEPPLQTPPNAPLGIPVLVTDGKEIVVAAWGLSPESCLFTLMFGKYSVGRPEPEWWMGEMKLTHWMPLPALPREEVITDDREGKGGPET